MAEKISELSLVYQPRSGIREWRRLFSACHQGKAEPNLGSGKIIENSLIIVAVLIEISKVLNFAAKDWLMKTILRSTDRTGLNIL